MRQIPRSKIFWTGFVLGVLGMLVLSLWQLGWLPYFYYGWDTFLQIPFWSFEVLSAAILSILTGFNLGGFLHLNHLHRSACRPGTAGLPALLGTVLWPFTLACLACNAVFLVSFGTALNLAWLIPYLPALQIVSFSLLSASAYLLIRKLQNTVCKI